MEGTVPTEATEGQNGRGVELASVELARVELANQTGVGKPSSSGDNSDGGVNRDVQHDAGIDFSSKHQSNGSDMGFKVARSRLDTIIAEGKTYKVRKMIALLLLLKHPGLPWKTSGEAAKAIFSSGRHCINKHNKYWKEKMLNIPNKLYQIYRRNLRKNKFSPFIYTSVVAKNQTYPGPK